MVVNFYLLNSFKIVYNQNSKREHQFFKKINKKYKKGIDIIFNVCDNTVVKGNRPQDKIKVLLIKRKEVKQ